MNFLDCNVVCLSPTGTLGIRLVRHCHWRVAENDGELWRRTTCGAVVEASKTFIRPQRLTPLSPWDYSLLHNDRYSPKCSSLFFRGLLINIRHGHTPLLRRSEQNIVIIQPVVKRQLVESSCLPLEDRLRVLASLSNSCISPDGV